MHPILHDVTQRLIERSRPTRERYLAQVAAGQVDRPHRQRLSCGNLAHGFAACPADDKAALRAVRAPNLAIVTSYNDMLSAHQPYGDYPERIKAAARAVGATAQVAGGVPAMCDGVTQGQGGMQLSLFSRDVIALSTAVALTHDMFDAALLLGICDKIVPGLLIGALAFGHLPALFVPGGPMPTGASNEEKSKVRKRYAEGLASQDELLDVEARSYHAPGTCTFYGTANSNQMLLEFMGLQLPGSSFVHPGSELRRALTDHAVQRAAAITSLGGDYLPLGRIVDERAIVNAVVGLHATGGSTNHLLHLVAIAQRAGIDLRLDDFAHLASVVPLLARVYPNGRADVNQFDAAGGIAFVIDQLLDAYAVRPRRNADGALGWVAVARDSMDEDVVRPLGRAFRADGGLQVLDGTLGRAVIKVSSVPADRLVIEAPVQVFDDQDAVYAAFARGEIERDVIVVVRFQGPRANGMPELHKLTPTLQVLQERGFRVALLTDGRMSGASGQVPAAIHLTPEAADGGPIAKLRDGDVVRIDAQRGTLDVAVDAEEWQQRAAAVVDLAHEHVGLGRDLFAVFRNAVGSADRGASVFGGIGERG